MARHERYGTRDNTISRWHRTLSDRCQMVDIDACEYCKKCKSPIALIEYARDVGQEFKPATITTRLANDAGIAAYVVLYSTPDGWNPAVVEEWEQVDWPKVLTGFRVQQTAPTRTKFTHVSYDQFKDFVEQLHEHDCRRADMLRRVRFA